MLSIRMQRLGRKGHPVYRVVVQDSRQAPTSGKYVAMLGSYDPHTKTTTLEKEKAEFYLSNGAQPSERVVRLFTAEKVKLPSWVEKPAERKREIRNAEKLRRNRPAEEAAPAEETPVATDDAPAETEEAPAAEKPADENKEVAEAQPEESKEETPAEESSPEETEEQPVKEPAEKSEEEKTA